MIISITLFLMLSVEAVSFWDENNVFFGFLLMTFQTGI